MQNEEIKLNLGSGRNRMEGYLNVDILELPEVDIVCDVTKGIPLTDNSVSAVWASHFVEHIRDTVALMEELYRVCKPGAIVEFKVPYFMSASAFKDPTHVTFLTERTWEYFDRTYAYQRKLPEYRLKCDYRLEHVGYIWYQPWTRFLPFKKAFWMKHFWNIAKTMYVRLRVVK